MEIKTCKKCEQSLTLENFYPGKQRGPNGQLWHYYDSFCKKCRCEYQSERRRKIKRQCVEYLGGKCFDCGLRTDRFEVYDFHHRDPCQKDLAIGKQTITFSKLKSELDKCDLLCANCHRLKHGNSES